MVNIAPGMPGVFHFILLLMITIIIIAVTSVISILAFNNNALFSKLLLNPYQVTRRREWYRVFTHGFLHADWVHLIVNMLVFYSFGTAVEAYFGQLADLEMIRLPGVWFIMLYVSAIAIASIVTLIRHASNYNYNAVGASGAVSAILFTAIFFAPLQQVLFYAVIPIPGILFGVLYLVYSQYMSRRDADNVNHDAHFYGAVYGFLFPLIIDLDLIWVFLNQLTANI
jgi:membrane associated rhomboid family serine protease